MRILALDLGTKTGWAVGDESGVRAGTWALMKPAEITAQAKIRFDRRLDARIPRLHERIRTLLLDEPFDWIVFEDVLFSSTTLQAHLWASLRATVWLTAHLQRVRVECVNTASLKKFATGHGGATKEMMEAWLNKKCPGMINLDDNAVDAVHLLLWAQKTLKV